MSSLVNASNQLAANVAAHAVEESHDIWTKIAIGVPDKLDRIADVGREAFHPERQKKEFDAVFQCAELQVTSGVQQLLNGIKAPSDTKGFLNTQQSRILAELVHRHNTQDEQPCICPSLKKEGLASLQELANQPGKGRNHLNYYTWQAFDKVNFKNVQACFHLLFEEFKKNTFHKITQDMAKFCDYRESLIAEILAQLLAYTEGLHGKTLHMPSITADGIELIPYKIRESFLGDSLPCYIMEPENAASSHRPWLVIRGTQHHTAKTQDGKEYRLGAFESLLADMIDSNGIAEDVVNKGLVNSPIRGPKGARVMRESLGSLLISCKLSGKQLNIAGHSLGGTLAKYIAAQFPNQIHRSYCFSSPGISDKAHEIYKKLRKNFGTKEKIVNILYHKDPFHLVGSWQIGTKLQVTPLKISPNRGYIEAHVRPHLNKDFGIRVIKSKEENYKFARHISEFVRWFLGRIAYGLICLLRPSAIPDWYRNRHIYQVRKNHYLKTYFPEYL